MKKQNFDTNSFWNKKMIQTSKDLRSFWIGCSVLGFIAVIVMILASYLN